MIQKRLQNVAIVPSNQSNANESNISAENSFERTMNEIKRSSQKSTNINDSDLFSNCDVIIETLQKYSHGPTIALSKNPLEYWKHRSDTSERPWTREFANVAKKYLTAPPTSADVERLFSIASKILTQIRNRTLPANAEKQLFLHENLALLKFQY